MQELLTLGMGALAVFLSRSKNKFFLVKATRLRYRKFSVNYTLI
jgi:hypothetical protein